MICEVRLLSSDLTFTGKRTWWMSFNETKGFHHFRVMECTIRPQLVGKVIAVPLSNMDYLIIKEG